MNDRLTALERAFELARSGEYANTSEVKKQLKTEGYSDAQITGPTLTRQLKALCLAARQEA